MTGITGNSAPPLAAEPTYRRDLDGLRGVAIALVLLFHYRFGLRGGFIGVDVFFVLSGYLITSILLRDINARTFSYRRFWERRVRRLAPALAAMVAGAVFVGACLLMPRDLRDLGRSVVAQSLLVANVFFYRESDYFGAPAELMPLLNLWSLAVEEQFYLIIPSLLSITLTKLRWRPITILSGLFAASFAYSSIQLHRDPSAAFYLLPSRAWEMLLGSLVATAPRSLIVPGRFRESIAWLSGIAILTAAMAYDGKTPFPGPLALIPCVGAAGLIWSNDSSMTVVGRVLATQPLVWLGRISYSLYLWHWPLLSFMEYAVPDRMTASTRLLLLIASAGIGQLSYGWIEQPFRQRRIASSPLSLFGAYLAVQAVIIAIGLVGYFTDGLRSRFDSQTLAFADGATDRDARREVRVHPDGHFDFVQLGTPGAPVHCIVWGDSHAMAALPAIDSLAQSHRVAVLGAVHRATAPLVEFVSTAQYSLKSKSTLLADAVLDVVEREHIPHTILIAHWDAYHFGTTASRGLSLEECLENTVRRLRATGTHVWLVQEVPQLQFDVPRRLAVGYRFPSLIGPPAPQADEFLQLANDSRTAIARNADKNCSILDAAAAFIDESGQIRIMQDGRPLFADHHHLSRLGATRLVPVFTPVFDRSFPDSTPR